MGKFRKVTLMIVNRITNLPENSGWACDCKTMLLTAFPGLPKEVFERPEIQQLLDEVDNQTGVVYVWGYLPGDGLWANSTLEKLLKEVK